MTAYEEGYELGSIVNIHEKVTNPYKDGTNQFYDWWKGFDHAIEDRIS